MNHKLSSTAVKARRHEPADSLDFFPTPPWATRAFCEHVMPALWGHAGGPWPDIFQCEALEPACGEGHMAVALAEYFGNVTSSDVHDYGHGWVRDFMLLDAWEPASFDWVITNPPFNLAEPFVRQALRVARRGVAMLVRTTFLEGQSRYHSLFLPREPQIIAQFAERVPMHKGRWDPAGKTATAYCWVAWRKHVPHDWRHTRFIWIPPCRKALTRNDDAIRFNAASAVPLLEGAR